MSFSLADWSSFAAAVIAVLAIGIAVWQVRENRRQTTAQVYLSRYWLIDDDLLLTPKSDPSHRSHRHRYLRLCEDEYFAVKSGTLDLKYWHAWHAWLASPLQRVTLESDLVEVDPDQERFEFLRACLSAQPDHGWKDCPSR